MRWLVCRPHWRRKRNRYEGAARRKSAVGFALRRFPPRTFIDYTYPQQLNDERLSPRGQNSTRTGGQNSMRADIVGDSQPCLKWRLSRQAMKAQRRKQANNPFGYSNRHLSEGAL